MIPAQLQASKRWYSESSWGGSSGGGGGNGEEARVSSVAGAIHVKGGKRAGKAWKKVQHAPRPP